MSVITGARLWQCVPCGKYGTYRVRLLQCPRCGNKDLEEVYEVPKTTVHMGPSNNKMELRGFAASIAEDEDVVEFEAEDEEEAAESPVDEPENAVAGMRARSVGKSSDVAVKSVTGTTSLTLRRTKPVKKGKK